MIKVLKGYNTMDGAGVRLFRVFSNETVNLTDPFLLLDHFGSDDPKDYIKGFPWHPHRGIETVTYLLKGEVEHQDSLGNKGTIKPGDVQWMSAGSGIIHQEMPRGASGMEGFQLWVNMPSAKKMTAPKYRGIEKKEIPTIRKDGAEIKVIAGEYNDVRGPAAELVIDILYLDITLKAKTFCYTPKKGFTTLCYVVRGKGRFLDKDAMQHQLALFTDTGEVTIKPEGEMRFLLISGKPIKESITWGGSIVMNTQAELEHAFRELDDGTFIKAKAKN
jgi:quercetin 2,3-dioxygenase